MPVYLYCLLTPAADAPPAELRGVGGGGGRVRAMDAGGIQAWVEDVDPRVVRATADVARVHDAVIRVAMERETPLPARFGQLFPDDDALRESLSPRREMLLAALGRVAGMVEMNVRVLLDDQTSAEAASEPASAPSGRSYLLAVKARHAALERTQERAEFLQERVAEAVRGVAREERRSSYLASARSLGMSHLVPRDAVARYRAAVRALSERDPALRLLISGPWAPYSFSEPRE
jgi:hypothetical protein